MKEETRLKLKEIFEKDYDIDEVIESVLVVVEEVCGLEDNSLNYAVVGRNVIGGNIPSLYLPSEKAIIFNDDWLKASDKTDLIFHTLYTARFAYQHLAILGTIKEEQNNINGWKYNFNNYERPTGNEDMDSSSMKTDIEIDARGFATLLMKRFYDVEYSIPNQVKEEVEEYMDMLDKKYFSNTIID